MADHERLFKDCDDFCNAVNRTAKEIIDKRNIFAIAIFIAVFVGQKVLAGEVIAVVNIMNSATSQCLDSYWSNGESGSDVKLYHCDGSPEQEWILEKVPYNTVFYNTGFIQIKNEKYPNLCLDIKGGAFNKGTQVWLYHCWNYTDKKIEAQLFDVTYGFYHTDYYTGEMSLGRISIEKFFERGNTMISTWIRPFFGDKLVFDIVGGCTNGSIGLYPAHKDVTDESTRLFCRSVAYTDQRRLDFQFQQAGV